MQKPEWYEEEVERIMALKRIDRPQAEKHIADEIAEYIEQYEEFEDNEEIAWEYYDYVRQYFIDKEKAARSFFASRLLTGEPTTMFEARLHYECMHLSYFDDFEKCLENRRKKQKI